MAASPLYPLRFEPIFKKAIWGGRRLGDFLDRPLPGSDAVGEAWVLSDQGDSLSRVSAGPLQGRTLRSLVAEYGKSLLGHGHDDGRFPLLLKFIDARQPLSVQVHPHDRHAHLIPAGDRGKTEAWLVIEADPGSRIYAGLKPGVGPEDLKRSLADSSIAGLLHAFEPRPGDCLFLPAGTVHALGAGVLIFEVQQTSDVTFRLYDWDRVDARTGQPRQLHVKQALECIDFQAGPCHPAVASPGGRLVSCEYFTLDRHRSRKPLSVGQAGSCRILVGIGGEAVIEHDGQEQPLRRGEVLLVPASLGPVLCRPREEFTFLECGLLP